MSERVIEMYRDADELVTAVGDRLVTAIISAIATRGIVHVC